MSHKCNAIVTKQMYYIRMKTQINQTALFTAVIMVCCIIKRSDNMFSNLELINAMIEHVDEQGGVLEDFFFETEKEMAGHLLWDIWCEQNDVSLEDEDWDSMNILIKANWIKKGKEQFNL